MLETILISFPARVVLVRTRSLKHNIHYRFTGYDLLYSLSLEHLVLHLVPLESGCARVEGYTLFEFLQNLSMSVHECKYLDLPSLSFKIILQRYSSNKA